MDTTAPSGHVGDGDAQRLLERLESVDAAEAPEIADELARLLSASVDDTPTQLAAEFDSGAGR